MPKAILLLILLLQLNFLLAQKESNIWYFGRDGAGLDFNCIPPSVKSDHNMTGWEGTCTVSDPNTGKLLFYTNGDNIFSRNHLQMQNGTYITPTAEFFEPLNTNTQVLAIPRPGTPDQYYLIATDTQGGKIQSANQSLNGVWAVLIDMTQNGGFGDVVDRFQVYNPLFATEKLMAVRHANGEDIWVIGHEFDNDRFFVVEVTAAGFASSPDIYAVGSSHSTTPGDFDNLNALGELKASPDGSKLASIISGDGIIEIFDFDNSTGEISNAQFLGTEQGSFGASFSPDNSKLYVSTWTGDIFQFDLNASDIPASSTLIFNYPGGSFASMKIAPDFKIYVSRYQGGPYEQDGGDQYLGIINNPNEVGAACNYEHNGIFLEGLKCNWGLNNVMEQTSFEQIELAVDLGEDLTLPCDAIDISLDAFNECAEYLWQDGSTEATYDISAEGIYWVDVIYGNCIVSDTINIFEEDIEVTIDLGNDTILCLGESLILDASIPGDASYLWQDGSTNPTLEVESAGLYSVTVEGTCGIASDEINIEVGGAAFTLDNTLEFPNAFTPDNDGNNDIFTPVIKETIIQNILEYNMTIYNRWGNVIFESSEPTTGWNGSLDNKNAASEVYIWSMNISIRSCNGNVENYQKTGDLIIIK